MRTIQDIKLIPIRDFLAHRGITPKQENSRYGFIFHRFERSKMGVLRWITCRICGMTSAQVVVARLSTL